MIPINKVRDLISKHTLLEKELSTGEIDKNKFEKVIEDIFVRENKFITKKVVMGISARK